VASLEDDWSESVVVLVEDRCETKIWIRHRQSHNVVLGDEQWVRWDPYFLDRVENGCSIDQVQVGDHNLRLVYHGWVRPEWLKVVH